MKDFWSYFFGYIFACGGSFIFIRIIYNELWKEIKEESADRDHSLHLWYGQVIGIVEGIMYVTAFLLDKWEFIGIWLAFKVVGRWERSRIEFQQKKKRGILGKLETHAIYSIFTIGNALSLVYAFFGYKIIRYLQVGELIKSVFIVLIIIGFSFLLKLFAERQSIKIKDFKKSLSAEPKEVVNIKECNKENSAEKFWDCPQTISVLANFANIVIAVCTVLIVIYTNQQANILKQQFQAASRPWVGFDNENGLQTSPMIVDSEGNIRLKVDAEVKNFGDFPGTNVYVGAELIITQEINSVLKKEQEMCSLINSTYGYVLFPGKDELVWPFTFTVKPSQMIRNSRGDDSEFSAYIVGCILYRDQFKKFHYTGFSFRQQIPNTIKGAAFKPVPNSIVQGEWVKWHNTIDNE
jgi:hypothetical protein